MPLEPNDLREVFETILPEGILMDAVRAAGLQERERKLDAIALLRAMIISASSGGGGRQADAMQCYFQSGATRVVRGSFYGWFGGPLERVMDRVRDLALDYARRQPVDLPGVLGRYVRDWHIIDATTVTLAKRLMAEYPGAGDYAALKVHKRFSVGLGTTVGYHLSPARDHDSQHLTIDESWRGLGLLADLAYASLDRLRACDEHGVKYVIRLKENWKPRVDHIVRGTVTREFTKGSDLDLLLADETLLLDGKNIDADVTLGTGPNQVKARLVGVLGDKGNYCFYLTNLSPVVAPSTIADLYRIRWEIESDNKLDKSCSRLDQIDARTGPAVRALVHASLVGSIIVCLIAHHHRRREAPPPRPGAQRTTPPIHPQALARSLAIAAYDIARVMERPPDEAAKDWVRLANAFSYQTDPNWRNRPSILDQLRGWRIMPGRPRKARASRASLN